MSRFELLPPPPLPFLAAVPAVGCCDSRVGLSRTTSAHPWSFLMQITVPALVEGGEGWGMSCCMCYQPGWALKCLCLMMGAEGLPNDRRWNWQCGLKANFKGFGGVQLVALLLLVHMVLKESLRHNMKFKGAALTLSRFLSGKQKMKNPKSQVTCAAFPACDTETLRAMCFSFTCDLGASGPALCWFNSLRRQKANTGGEEEAGIFFLFSLSFQTSDFKHWELCGEELRLCGWRQKQDCCGKKNKGR